LWKCSILINFYYTQRSGIIILNKSLKDIVNEISSEDPPVPAGGTTIAINGLLGVSLFRLTYMVSKKTWTKDIINRFAIDDNLQEAEGIYIKAMDEDPLAFKKSMESQEILNDIIEIPLKIALYSKKIHILAIKLEPYIKKTIRADHHIAKDNLITTMKGGIEIIESNYNFFDEDCDYIKRTKEKVKTVKDYFRQYRN